MSAATVDVEKSSPASVEDLGDALALFVRYPSPWLIFLTACGMTTWRLWLGGFGMVDAAIAAGIIAFWPILEWLIHVFILHFKPFNLGKVRVDLHLASEHRDHHERPWVLPKVFVPIRAVVLGIFAGLPLFLWAWSTALPLAWGLTAVSVFFVFGTLYEWTHFLVHTSYKPRGRFYKRLWRNHRLHHFKNENYWYGVTRLEGDVVLGTSPDPKDVEKSPTARSIV